MRSMPLHEDSWYFQDYELNDVVDELKRCLILDIAVPIDLYVDLENWGIDVEALIKHLEAEINGKSDDDYSYWGC